jgi:hypothetical protein
MTAIFSAIMCAFRHDIVPALCVRTGAGLEPAMKEPAARRRAMAAAAALILMMLAVFCALHILRSGGGNEFLVLVFALFCAQLSFVPLVVGPVIGRIKAGAIAPGWALAAVGCGVVAGIACGARHLAGAGETWLWTAVPASLGASALVLAASIIASQSAQKGTV